MIRLTENEERIIENAYNAKKYLISRQDDSIRDEMIIAICRKIRQNEVESTKKYPILIVIEDKKYSNFRRYGIFDKEKKKLNLRIINYSEFLKKIRFYQKSKNAKFSSIIIDDFNRIHKSTLYYNGIYISDIDEVFNNLLKNNKDIKIIVTYDGFLRKGIVDLYVLFLMFFVKEMYINNLKEPEDFLRIMVETFENNSVPFTKRKVKRAFVPEFYVKKIKESVGFDDFENLTIPNVNISLFRADNEVKDELCKEIVKKYKNGSSSQIIFLNEGGFYDVKKLSKALIRYGIKNEDISIMQFYERFSTCQEVQKELLARVYNKIIIVEYYDDVLFKINKNIGSVYFVSSKQLEGIEKFYNIMLAIAQNNNSKCEIKLLDIKNEDLIKRKEEGHFGIESLDGVMKQMYEKVGVDKGHLGYRIATSYKSFIDEMWSLL